MKKRTKSCWLRLLSTFFILHFSSFIGTAATIDLSGQWELQLDPHDQGITEHWWSSPTKDGLFNDTIHLPGTTSQAHMGNPLSLKPVLPKCPPEDFNPKRGLMFDRDQSALTNSALAHLYQRFSYIGPAWYRRSVEMPKSWAGKDVELVLERVMWQSQVWVNGQFMGARNSLSTPQCYEIGRALKPGRNEIVIRVDNRRQLAIGDPSAYTEQTQTIWNGIIGRIALVEQDKVHINRLELRPDLARRGVAVTVFTHNDGRQKVKRILELQAAPDNFKGKPVPALKSPVLLPPGDSERTIFYPMGTNFQEWSEFSPKLYRMRALLTGEGSRSKIASDFGMREFKAVSHHFFINGRPTFLRGTVESCVFPKTGYPDMTGKQWRKMFSTLKAYGLNAMRFHTWCPPEIAFEMADRCGIYLEVELPNWCFHIGQNTNVTAFFRREGERMIREYGNHPSWVMFTMGNELKGNYRVLDELESHFRKFDPQLLYDSTTYPRDMVPEPEDDYYISQDTKCGRARGQDIFNDTTPNTETNFARAVSCIHIPFISHEVGQYCVYPDLAEIPKYNGVLRNLAFEAIRNDLKKKGRLAEAPIYTRDSGKLAALLYKEEVERALRTTNQAGFYLLALNDFPGQGTSTVGLLNAFWNSKGLITPAAFRKFCGPVVPLLLMPKFVWQNDETFNAGIEIANFGPVPITNATVVWKISDGDRRIGGGSFKIPFIPLGNGIQIGRIHQSFSTVTNAAKLKVTISVEQASSRSRFLRRIFRNSRDARPTADNDWPIWVYPVKETAAKTNDIAIFRTPDEAFYQALQDGKRVLLLPSRADVKSPLAAQFVPVFWNPVMFSNQPGTMGAMIDVHSPVFADFPTDPWSNWQWWGLLHHSFAINLNAVPVKLGMSFRFVDKFNRNALPAAIFEARVGDGRLLVCTLDITHNLNRRIVARQLRRSILDYMAGDKFQPDEDLIPTELKRLFP
jgi:Glycosyl hydrolases family 2, sugar binding domain/Glycosyl hydrolases family 2, TIM barrel domain